MCAKVVIVSVTTHVAQEAIDLP